MQVIQTYSQSTTCYNLLPDYVSAHVMEQVNWEERDAQTLDICRNEQNCTACSDSQILYFLLFIRFILFGITIGSASGTSVKSCLTLREMMLCCVQSVQLKSKVSF
jgi:hypothetical protein